LTLELYSGLGTVQSDSDRWRDLQAATTIDLSSPESTSAMYVLVLPETTAGFRVLHVTATGSDLIAVLQDGVKSVLEATLQTDVEQPTDGVFDGVTWDNVRLMSELLGQPQAQIWQGCTLQNFATALVSSRQLQTHIRNALGAGSERVDGGMLLYPHEGEFIPPSVPDVQAGPLPLTAPEGNHGYGIHGS
jgi:hypothetical protein